MLSFYLLFRWILMSTQISFVSTGQEPLSVVEQRNWGGMESLRACWSNLAAQLPGLSIFLTPEWLFSWWLAYGENKTFCVLTFSTAHEGVVGIAPLYWERRELAPLPALRVLRFMGDGSSDSDDLDFIVKPGYAARVAQALLEWMRRAQWDICEFNCLSSKSEVAALLVNEVRAAGWKIETSERPLSRITFPATWEKYLKTLSAKERGKIGHRLRHLQARHPVQFRRCTRSDELPEFLNTLYALHQKRWESRGEPGSFALPARRRFYLEMTRELLGRGWLELWQLEMDGTPVASQIGMRYGSRVYALQEGFDPAYATDSVGYVLRSQILRNCIDSGARSYDFLYGDQESKLRWGAEIGHYIDLRFSRKHGYGAIYLTGNHLWRGTKTWLRTHLPANALKMLQKLRSRMQRRRPQFADAVASPTETGTETR